MLQKYNAGCNYYILPCMYVCMYDAKLCRICSLFSMDVVRHCSNYLRAALLGRDDSDVDA